ncbi:MAG: hypothetical protein ACYDDB_07440 [bacterium]
MNKLKIKEIKVFISIMIIAAVMSLTVIAGRAYAVIGQSYNSMVSEYGRPESLPLNKAVNLKKLQRYQTEGVSVSSYKFTINGFKMITLFNSSNICYEIKTYHNRALPDPKDLIGSLAGSEPAVLNRIPFRSITLRYGSGANAVIYRTFGLPGDLSAVAYSPALRP